LLEKIRLAELFPNHNIRYGTFRSQALMARHEGNLELAIEKFQQALAIARDLRWKPNELDMMEEMAYTYYLAGDPDLAMSIFSDALQQSKRIGHFNLLVWKMIGLAMINLQAGQHGQAQAMFKERLLCQPDDTVTWQIALSLAGLGKLAWLEGDAQEAALLLGASEAMVERDDLLPFAWFTDEWRQIMTDLKPGLEGESWERGRVLSGPQAIDHALRQSVSFPPS
jgi:tetratricopeptide (TPR) repeat protein